MRHLQTDEDVAQLFTDVSASLGPSPEGLRRALREAGHIQPVSVASPYLSLTLLVRAVPLVLVLVLTVFSGVVLYAPHRIATDDQVIQDVALSLDATVSAENAQLSSIDASFDESLRAVDPASYNGSLFDSLNI